MYIYGIVYPKQHGVYYKHMDKARVQHMAGTCLPVNNAEACSIQPKTHMFSIYAKSDRCVKRITNETKNRRTLRSVRNSCLPYRLTMCFFDLLEFFRATKMAINRCQQISSSGHIRLERKVEKWAKIIRRNIVNKNGFKRAVALPETILEAQ